jgi:hypothetical protein
MRIEMGIYKGFLTQRRKDEKIEERWARFRGFLIYSDADAKGVIHTQPRPTAWVGHYKKTFKR